MDKNRTSGKGHMGPTSFSLGHPLHTPIFPVAQYSADAAEALIALRGWVFESVGGALDA